MIDNDPTPPEFFDTLRERIIDDFRSSIATRIALAVLALGLAGFLTWRAAAVMGASDAGTWSKAIVIGGTLGMYALFAYDVIGAVRDYRTLRAFQSGWQHGHDHLDDKDPS